MIKLYLEGRGDLEVSLASAEPCAWLVLLCALGGVEPGAECSEVSSLSLLVRAFLARGRLPLLAGTATSSVVLQDRLRLRHGAALSSFTGFFGAVHVSGFIKVSERKNIKSQKGYTYNNVGYF